MQNMDIERATASFFPRLGAYLLDRLIAGAGLVVAVRLPLTIASFSTELFTREIFFRFNLRQILCWVVVSAYFTVFTVCSGATPGKRAFGMRVVSADGEPLSLLTVLYRETVGRYLSSLLCIGYLFVLGDTEHRALHDRLCNTLVIFSDPRPHRENRRPNAPKAAIPASVPSASDWYRPNR